MDWQTNDFQERFPRRETATSVVSLCNKKRDKNYLPHFLRFAGKTSDSESVFDGATNCAFGAVESDGDENEIWDSDDDGAPKADAIEESRSGLHAVFDVATLFTLPSFAAVLREQVCAAGDGAGEEKGCKMLRQASSKSVDEPKRAASLVCIIFRDLNINSKFNAFQNVTSGSKRARRCRSSNASV